MRRLDVPAKQCKQCGTPFGRETCKRISDFKEKVFCSQVCFHAYATGTKHPNWRGGIRRGHPDGYLRVTDGRYIHRIVKEQELGRKLSSAEHVHHGDEVKDNNVPENLEVMSNSEHRKLHCKTQKRGANGRFCI